MIGLGGTVPLRIAVTGSTGSVGGQVVRLLAAQGHQVTALARRPVSSPAQNVRSVFADYDQPESLRSALSGADALVFISSDGEAAKMILHHQNVVRAAEDARVGSIVYLSGLDAELDSPFCYAFTNGYTEQLLAQTDSVVSITRASIFTEFFQQFLDAARASGELRLPMATRRISLVSRLDVARSLAALTLSPTSSTQLITGPEALDLAALAEIAGAAWGRPIAWHDIEATEFATDQAATNEPWWAYAFYSMFESVRKGSWELVSDDIQRLTGEKSVSLLDTLRDAGS
jgi:NAD(P)H dehydrogenase (quinone)